MRIRLFKSGQEFDEWATRNCDRCAVPNCPFLKEIIEGQTDLDKSVSSNTARSVGWKNGEMGSCKALRRKKKDPPKDDKPYRVFLKDDRYKPW